LKKEAAMAVDGVLLIPETFDLDDDEPGFEETNQRTITVCGVPMILSIFDRDDDDPNLDETGTFALNLGALRRFAGLDHSENRVPDERVSGR
jgi:hypothetical protein